MVLVNGFVGSNCTGSDFVSSSHARAWPNFTPLVFKYSESFSFCLTLLQEYMNMQEAQFDDKKSQLSLPYSSDDRKNS